MDNMNTSCFPIALTALKKAKVANERIDNLPEFNIISYGSSDFAETSYVISYENGTMRSATVTYYCTDYINISGLSNIKVTAPVLTADASKSGVAFYNSSKQFISGVSHTVDANSSNWTDLLDIDVPENAVYMRTAYRVSQIDSFCVFTMGISGSLSSDVVSIQNGLTLFEKIGVISDSISCGWAKDKNGNNSSRNLGISWVQQLARRYGNTSYNLGASGVDPIEWFEPSYEFAEYCYTQYQSVGACDLYIIGLGLNGGTLGTIADINESDYTQNASTFYGQYARIIQMINDEHPNAIVICLTEPTTRISNYDQAVRDICALGFINAQLVDLENDYFALFNTPEILAEHQPDGLHFTPYGYTLLANAMETALNDYISKNTSAFKYVGVS